MQYFTTFLSKRNVPLILNHLPEEDKPLLTTENWPVWEEESIYVVYHDGLVESILDDKFLNRGYYKLINNSFSGGLWNPEFLIALEEELGIDWDQTSLDLLYGRWKQKQMGSYE